MKLLSTALTCAALICSNYANAEEVWISVDDVKSDIALAEEAYSRIHPGYTRYASASDMSDAWDDIIERAVREGGLTLEQLYLEVERALVTIRCDHTKAELPAVLADRRKEGAYYLPFRWSLIEGRGFVSVALEETGLEYGDELLEIDGRSLTETVKAVEGFIPVDGYTEWSRRGGISESLEFMGGAVDHFGALLWGVPETAELLIQKPSGETRLISLDRIGHQAWTELGDENKRARNFKDAVTFERIGDTSAYLRVDTFVNYRVPVKPDEIYGPIFEAIIDEGRTSLILDLRNNGGGSTDASNGLLAHLITKKLKTSTDSRVATLNIDGLRDHLSTWDSRALNPNPLGFKKNKDGSYSLRSMLLGNNTVKPDRDAFEGELIILTSDNNSSGSTNLIALLDGVGRTTLVGEKTGGSAEGPTAGILFTLTLPESGIKTRIPIFWTFNNVPEFEFGLGVSPDIYAPMTVDAFLAKRDPALEKAIKLATGQDKT